MGAKNSPTLPKVIEYTSEVNGMLPMYACGMCRLMVHGGRDAAERCCLCERCDQPKQRHYAFCEEHLNKSRAERDAADRAEYEALPVANDIIDFRLMEAVWVNGRFCYGGVDEAAEWVFLDSDEPIDEITYEAYPCRLGTADVPDLTEYVHEAFSEQYDEGLDELPSDIADALNIAQAVLYENAPRMVIPVRSHRLVLALNEEEDA